MANLLTTYQLVTALNELEVLFVTGGEPLPVSVSLTPSYLLSELISQQRLRSLGKRHQQLTGTILNWNGTYHHAAERFLTHLEWEQR